MTAKELLQELMSWAVDPVDKATTVDTFKAGDPDKEVRCVAVTMTATSAVIRRAMAMGADMLIVHEPTFYNNDDRVGNDPVSQQKAALVAESSLAIARFHDHAHAMVPDLICEGELRGLALAGRFEKGPHFAVNRYVLDEPITARALAARAEQTLGARCVRIIGDPDAPGTRLLCAFGTPGYTREDILAADIMLTGEICEWGIGEFLRDAGDCCGKAALVMSHIGSERAGMQLLAEKVAARFPELTVHHIETDELYHYTDD